MAVDPNNHVNLSGMTNAEIAAAYQNGTLTPEQARAARQLYPELADASSGNGNTTPLSIETGTVTATVAATADGYSNGIAVADLADGGGVSEEIADSGAADSSDTGGSYVANNRFDPLDPFDGINDQPRMREQAPHKDPHDVYGGSDQNRKPLEQRLADRDFDKALHPERFEHRLFDGIRPPANDEEDRARIAFAHKAKAALAAGPEAVEALLADPKNRALIASMSPERNSIASNLIKQLSPAELKKLDQEKLSVDPQSAAVIKEKLAQPDGAPAPTAAKPATPAADAKAHIEMFTSSMDTSHADNPLLKAEAGLPMAGSSGDPRVPVKAHGKNYAGTMPKIIDLTRGNEPIIAANGQPTGKTPTPDQEHAPSIVAKKDPAQQHGPQAQAKNTRLTPVFGLGSGPAAPSIST